MWNTVGFRRNPTLQKHCHASFLLTLCAGVSQPFNINFTNGITLRSYTNRLSVLAETHRISLLMRAHRNTRSDYQSLGNLILRNSRSWPSFSSSKVYSVFKVNLAGHPSSKPWGFYLLLPLTNSEARPLPWNKARFQNKWGFEFTSSKIKSFKGIKVTWKVKWKFMAVQTSINTFVSDGDSLQMNSHEIESFDTLSCLQRPGFVMIPYMHALKNSISRLLLLY